MRKQQTVYMVNQTNYYFVSGTLQQHAFIIIFRFSRYDVDSKSPDLSKHVSNYYLK